MAASKCAKCDNGTFEMVPIQVVTPVLAVGHPSWPGYTNEPSTSVMLHAVQCESCGAVVSVEGPLLERIAQALTNMLHHQAAVANQDASEARLNSLRRN
jgi:hypothetical protein